MEVRRSINPARTITGLQAKIQRLEKKKLGLENAKTASLSIGQGKEALKAKNCLLGIEYILIASTTHPVYLGSVKFFVEEERMEVNKANYKGKTALDFAIKNAHSTVKDYLLANGASLTVEQRLRLSNQGQVMLHEQSIVSENPLT